jgi:hypothetical protein
MSFPCFRANVGCDSLGAFPSSAKNIRSLIDNVNRNRNLTTP